MSEKKTVFYSEYGAIGDGVTDDHAAILAAHVDANEKGYEVKADEGNFGLANVAATMVNLMGYEAPAMWEESIIDVK